MTRPIAPSSVRTPSADTSTVTAPVLSRLDRLVAQADSFAVGAFVSAATFMPAVHAFDSLGVGRDAALVTLGGATALLIGYAAARATFHGLCNAAARLAHV